MGEPKKKKSKSISRRDFLKGFGGGTLGAAIAPRLLSQEVSFLSTARGNIPLYLKKTITLTVNEKPYTLEMEPRDTLLDILRLQLNLTGAKRICNHGQCGGCTVLLDGNPVYACMYPALRAEGKKISTVEGLAESESLHPVQQAFIAKDAYQCGFCTPGFIMSSVAFLRSNPDPSLEEIKNSLSGNLCRCGNYAKIFEAVSMAAKSMVRS